MKENKNDIDNFFRDSISGLEYEDRKGNWELMDHLLNEKQKKKKRRAIVFFLFAGVIIIAGLYFSLPIKETVNHQISEQTATTKKDHKNTDEKNINSLTPENFTSSKNQTTSKSKTAIPPLIPNVTGKQYAAGQKKNISSPTKNNLSEISSSLTDAEINTLQTASAEDTIATKDNNLNGSNIPEENTQQPIPENTREVNNPTSIQSLTNDSTNSLPSIAVVSTDPLAIKSDSSSDSDSTMKLANKSNNFLMYAGANAYESGYDKINFSPLAGLAFRTSLDSLFRIEVAVLYSLQGGYHLNDTETVVHETYFLDKETDTYSSSINIRQQHKLYFPITLYYQFSKKYSLIAAMQVSFLLNTEGNYSEKNIVSGILSQTEKQNVKGYMDGIRTTNYSLTLGYQYNLSKRFDLQARITRDLLDTYDEDYFIGVDTGPLWSLQAFIIFRF